MDELFAVGMHMHLLGRLGPNGTLHLRCEFDNSADNLAPVLYSPVD